MRTLGLLIVVFSVAAVMAERFIDRGSERIGSATDLVFPSTAIHITGSGNTLASVAQHVNDPTRFTYDPETGTAVSKATLIIEGDLQIGLKDDPATGQTLELDAQVCGDLRINVLPGGALRMYHSKMRTISQILTLGACTRGYSLFVDGSLTMEDSDISYVSGSRSEFIRGQAEATIRRSTFSRCDGNALSLVDIDGARVVVEDCNLLSEGNWGVVVSGTGGEPAVIRDCVLEGKIGAVFVTGEAARLKLIDCVIGNGGIVFNGPSGEVEVAWTRRVKVIDEAGRPISGVAVRAQTRDDSPIPIHINAETNDEGLAELVLTEWISRPGEATKHQGINTAAGVDISIAGSAQRTAGAKFVMARATDTAPIEFLLP